MINNIRDALQASRIALKLHTSCQSLWPVRLKREIFHLQGQQCMKASQLPAGFIL